MSQGIKRTQKQLCGPMKKDAFDHDNHHDDDDEDDDATIERKSIKRSISSVSSTPRNNYDRRYSPTKTYGSQSKPTLLYVFSHDYQIKSHINLINTFSILL